MDSTQLLHTLQEQSIGDRLDKRRMDMGSSSLHLIGLD